MAYLARAESLAGELVTRVDLTSEAVRAKPWRWPLPMWTIKSGSPRLRRLMPWPKRSPKGEPRLRHGHGRPRFDLRSELRLRAGPLRRRRRQEDRTEGRHRRSRSRPTRWHGGWTLWAGVAYVAYIGTVGTAWYNYTYNTATAETTFVTAEANANATREKTVAELAADFDTEQAGAYYQSLLNFSQNNSSPWASHASALADAQATMTSTAAAGQESKKVAKAVSAHRGHD